MKINLTVFIALLFISVASLSSSGQQGNEPFSDDSNKQSDLSENSEKAILRMPHKLVPVNHSVYDLLGFYEPEGIFEGFLPLTKPYTKGTIVNYLTELAESSKLSGREKKVVLSYLNDFYRPVNGFIIKDHEGNQTYTVFGAGATIAATIGAGDNAYFSTSNIAEPFVGGDLGNHITYFASMGVAIDRLAPDLFYHSYVKDGEVHFPYQPVGYGFHPYQFAYETMWAHVNASGKSGEGRPVQNGDLTAGLIYRSEMSGSWFNNSLRISFHNQQRSWGVARDNLTLSARARRFPGIDISVQPTSWLRYSFLTGSLFSYANQRSNYKKDIYGYDLGNVQKNMTLHMLELTLGKHLRLAATGGNIWSKRLELAYLMPFVLPHFTQIDVGDHDNLSMGLDISLLFPKFGKTWFNLFVDEFSFREEGQLLKMPRNRYAWQWGWNTNLFSNVISGTQTQLSYTRVTPFVYTHYPESDFNPTGTQRPLDMTYSHDEANLGFYLPPNSGEFRLNFSNIAIPDVFLQLDNRFIIHGTNDLAGDTYQIFGDIYRHQFGDVHAYPLLDFTNDGIYDYTWFSELSAEYKARWVSYLDYFRLKGSLGYSKTWWETNQSNVAAPKGKSLFTFKFGVTVDF